MNQVELKILNWMSLVINGTCSSSASFHRMNHFGGGAFVIIETKD